MAALFLAPGLVGAAPFLYAPGDLVLVLRQTGGASDLVVNLGRASAFDGLTPGTNLPITRLDPAQLSAAFPSFNGLRWTVAGANRPPINPAFPLQTLWVTAPRVDVAQPAPAWLRKGAFVQGNAGSQIDALGANAALTSSLLPGGPLNGATGVVLPVAAAYPIGPVLGADGNFVGAFQGRVEAVTADDFDADTTHRSRADLYELPPGTSADATLNTAGRRLGYFEFQPDGTLSFHTESVAPAAPRITAITRVGDVATVSFTSTAGPTYRLRRADAAGLTAAIGTWAELGTVTGTGGVVSLQDTSSDANHFYAIEVQP